MKNLIIIGAPRAGKTTLAKQIAQKLNDMGNITSLISSDALMGGLQNMNKHFAWYSHIYRPVKHILPAMRQKYNQILLRELSSFIQQYLPEQSDVSLVIYEGCHITPSMAVKLFNPEKFFIVAIGYPNADIDKKMQDIRKYDKNTPAQRRNDIQLRQYLQNAIKFSKHMESECRKLKIPFIDTSHDYNGEIQKFINFVPKFLH